MCNLGTAGAITSHPLLAAGLTICPETPIYNLDMQNVEYGSCIVKLVLVYGKFH
jgi:hypothetical protein